METRMNATVHAVARDKSHRFSKPPAMFIRLIAGFGVEGDAHAGPTATIEVTGLRNPCAQIDKFRPGLLRAVLDRAPDGTPVRKSGIMAIVLTNGDIHPGDPITITLPPGPPRPLQVV